MGDEGDDDRIRHRKRLTIDNVYECRIIIDRSEI